MTRHLLVIAITVALQAGCGVSQAPLTCVIGQGGWFAKYSLKPNQTVTGACAQKVGEGLGVRKYFPAGQKPMVDIRTDTLGAMALQTPSDADSSHSPNSSGTLTAESPDSSNFCSIANFTKAEQNIPASAGGPGDIVYEWSNARFLTQANVPGTQMMASLKYTEGGCTAEYKVVAMQPFKDCTKMDAQGSAVLDAQGNPVADDSACRGSLSGVNPDFNVKCDPTLVKCTLVNDPPSLNATTVY